MQQPCPPKSQPSPPPAPRISPSGISRSSRPPTWRRTRKPAAAWSSSRGATASGNSSSSSSTAVSRRPATRTPISRCSSRSRYLEKEAEHAEGFATECAVVTHHRLEAVKDPVTGKTRMIPTGELAEPYVIRPTSRDHHRRGLRPLDRVLPRPAAAHQPVGQRDALGNAPPPFPAHRRIPLAGRPHRPRDEGGSHRGNHR